MKYLFSFILFSLSLGFTSAQRVIYQTNSGGWVQQQQHVVTNNSSNNSSQGNVNAQVQAQGGYGPVRANGNVQGGYSTNSYNGQGQTTESYQTNWVKQPNSAEQTYQRQRDYQINNNGTIPYVEPKDHYYQDRGNMCVPAPTAPSNQFYGQPQQRRRN